MRVTTNDFMTAMAVALSVGFMLGLLMSYVWCP